MAEVGKPVYSDGKVYVQSEKCVTCVFHPGNLMTLRPGRLKALVDKNVADGGALACHKTTYGQTEQEATCRGFFDAHAERVPALRLARAMGIIEEV